MNNLLTQKFPIAAFVLLFVLTLSCSHEPHDENQDPSNTDVHEWEDSTLSGDAVMGSAMTFKVGGGMSVERTAQTRATTDINGIATFSTGDLVAVAVTRSGGSEVIKLYQVKSDGSLEYAGGDNDPFVWKSTGETVSLRAWSYGTSTNLSYTLTAPETRDYTLETNQQNNGYRELLYCKADDKSYSGGTISLTFYHQLARMVFNVAHERTGTLAVTSYSMGNTTSFPIKASFTVPTGDSNVGTWTTGTTYGTITPKVESTQSGFQKTYSAVIFPRTYDQNTKFFTITNNEGDYVFNISESGGFTPTVGNQYNYTLTVKNYRDIKKNPLWYVAEYDVKYTPASGTSWDNGNGSFSWATTISGGYYFTWQTAMKYFTTTANASSVSGPHFNYQKGTGSKISGWHLPTAYEYNSISPTLTNVPDRIPIEEICSSTGSDAIYGGDTNVCFGYNDDTKGLSGTYMTENSYWYWKSINTWYAIRYCDSEYCSAWKYEFSNSDPSKPNFYLTISCTLLGKSLSTSEARTLYGKNDAMWNKIYFGNDYDAGAAQRSFYAGGWISNGNGSSPDNSIGRLGGGWSTSAVLATSGNGNSWHFAFDNHYLEYFRISTYSNNRNMGKNARLFRDN